MNSAQINLRPYQNKAVEELRASFRAGHRAPLFQLPTGGGKTFVFSYVASGASQRGTRVLILVHRKELLTQASMSLAKVGLRHTLIAQDKHVREAISLHVDEFSNTFIDLAAPVAVASVDTLIRRMGSIQKPGLIIPDEAHHVVPGNKWGRVLQEFNDSLVLGVTATPARTDGRGLGKHAGGFFDDLIIGPSPRELIELGFLLPPIVYAPSKKIDMAGARSAGGDWNAADLEERTRKAKITGDAVEHYRRLCPHVPAIAFCVSIHHAKEVADEFRAGGFDFRVIDGSMHDNERRNLIRALSRGQIDGLTSCDLISEGTDIPVVGCGIMLRLTQSEILYLQQVGRVLRPSPGQDRAFILDHVGNCFVHGLPDAEREWSLDGKPKRKKSAKDDDEAVRVVQCPSCYRAHDPAPACPFCGHVYENTVRKVSVEDGTLAEVKGAVADALRKKRQEVGRAKTLQDLEEIARERNYSPIWAKRVWASRKRRAIDL